MKVFWWKFNGAWDRIRSCWCLNTVNAFWASVERPGLQQIGANAAKLCTISCRKASLLFSTCSKDVSNISLGEFCLTGGDCNLFDAPCEGDFTAIERVGRCKITWMTAAPGASFAMLAGSLWISHLFSLQIRIRAIEDKEAEDEKTWSIMYASWPKPCVNGWTEFSHFKQLLKFWTQAKLF